MAGRTFDPADEAVSFNYIIMEHFDLTRMGGV